MIMTNLTVNESVGRDPETVCKCQSVMMDILAFEGDYSWLSNFWPAEIALDGMVFPSVEHAYQAAKADLSQRAVFLGCTAGKAKRLGRRVAQRADWERVRVDIMRSLIQQKFARGSVLGQKLKATGARKLVEGNAWGDVFLGVCEGQGRNQLGELLMEQRTLLQSLAMLP